MTPLVDREEQVIWGLTTLPGKTQAEVAECLGIHPNTLKYRLGTIRKKWGIGHHRGHLAGAIRGEAVRRGYGPQPDASLLIGDFVAQLLGTLPTSRLTPLSVGLRWWLEGEAVR